MINKNCTPQRRCMPLEEWPARDREAWAGAVRGGGLLDERGLAAHWRQLSKNSVISAYGRYLTFLALHGWLDEAVGPEARLTPDRLRAYIDELKEQVASVTLSGRIRNLAEALRVMVPSQSYSYLQRARYRLKARAHPSKNKRGRLVPSIDIVRLGLRLIEQAERGKFACAYHRAARYRDGLMILLLASRPLRLGNFSAIRLGHHLTKRGEAYQLSFEGEETKNHRPYACSIHQELTPHIDRYLEHFRPILLGAHSENRLWVAWGGRSMGPGSIYGVVTRYTASAFGRSISPHLFRDCAVTSLGAENPEHVWVGMSLLHHADPRTTEKYYDQALADQAVDRYQLNVREQRKIFTRANRGRKRKLTPPQDSIVLE
jgi:integrase/recombinase XerD